MSVHRGNTGSNNTVFEQETSNFPEAMETGLYVKAATGESCKWLARSEKESGKNGFLPETMEEHFTHNQLNNKLMKNEGG